jgi:Zn-dependent M16 (insulinase) family peptidase
MIHKSPHLQSVGQEYHGFKLVNLIEIPELQCILYELIHEASGAQIMHIGNEDPENLFCLSFPTFPLDSKGVAHILEHTVLCGSKKFPVKDPFFAMSRRSLNTFMNALTGSDFTCYPAATQVHKDFYNLLDVYLDAVFHPNLKELSFLQEGCRLEFSDPTNPDSPLEYKGIVYNEMKGSLSSATSRLAEAVNANLFPDVTYGYNSGGDPKDIPDLTYEEFKNFHDLFYQPGRCVFFFYGNMPLEKHLDFIAEQTLNGAQKVSKLPPIPCQPRFKNPVHKTLAYPIPPEEGTRDKTLISFAWLTCHISEQEEILALNILQNILLDTDASPLKMALLKSGLCTQVSYFIDVEINEIPIGLTLKGCNPEQADTLENLVRATLEKISLTAISPELIENAIHQLEFARSEITGDGSPFGLSLFMRSVLLKQHGVSPEQGLKIHSLFDQLRQHALSDPLYFGQLIKKYYLDNPHFVRIVMVPDPNLQAAEETEEKERLEKIKASLTSTQVQHIIDKAKELADFQQQQEEADDDILPKVTINEVPLLARDYPLVREQVGALEVFHHNVFTNEIVYADLAFDLPNLKEEDLPFLHLLEVVLTQVGSGERNYVENLDYIQGNTGGIGANVNLNLQAKDHNAFNPVFHLRGKSLYRKASKLFPLMLDTLNSPHLNNFERLREILFKHFTGMEGRLTQNSLKYAINLSASNLSAATKVANDLYGLPYFLKIREIVMDFEKQGPRLMEKLHEMRQKIIQIENPHLILGCDAQMYDELKRHEFYGLKQLETSTVQPWKSDFSPNQMPSQGRIIASPVAFIGKVFPTVSYVHPQAPALNVLAHLFDNLTLHPLIREQGGAYGGGAASNPMSGNFYFYSYRDPNITKTLRAFQEAIDTVANGDFDESDLEEAKLETIQSFDSPVSPGSQGEIAYCWLREGKTFDLRHKFRSQLLTLTREDLVKAVQEIIVPGFDKGVTAAFAGKSLLEEENRRLKADGFEPLHIENI